MTLTADPTTTPWAAGRLDGRAGPPRVLFGRTFEDPSIEDGLFPSDGEVLCIASAGDTARALAASGRRVIAVDINPAQIEEVRRRLVGQPAQPGAADHLLAIGRAALKPLGWRTVRLERLCRLDDPVEQAAEWRRLTSPVVRAAVRAALSPRALRLAFGEPFARLAPSRFGEVLLDRIGSRLASAPNRDNPWLAQLLTGRWTGPDPTMGSARIDLRCGDVASALDALPQRHSTGSACRTSSMARGRCTRTDCWRRTRQAARPGAPIVVRSFLVPTDPAARVLADTDRSLLWGGITVHRA